MSTVVHLISVLDKFKLLFFCICIPYYVSGICPDDVQSRAKACFRNYGIKIEGILIPGNSIISGVDAEDIRLLCTELNSGISCINDLRSKCPQNNALIDAELVQMPLAMDELKLLCRDDSFYEVYARNRYCYEKSGGANERCFNEVMNSTVRIITDLNQNPVAQYCSDVDNLLSCIGKALQDQQCSPEAIALKDKLTRPLIRGSQACDKSAYTVSSQNTTPSSSGNGRHTGNQGRHGPGSACSSLPNRTLMLSLIIVQIFSIALGFS